jgi:hypothetical protein
MTKEQIEKRLTRVEKELDKCRTTVREDGWQTQRHARKARKWDYYGKEKMRLLQMLNESTL